MTDLTLYGFTADLMTGSHPGSPARVTAVHRERYELICEEGACFGVLKSGAYFRAKPDDIPTTGDFVLVEYNPTGDSMIVRTLERRTYFPRRDPDPYKGGLAAAANFETVFILCPLTDPLNSRRLERYLALAWQSGAAPVVLLTKADLTDNLSCDLAAAQAAAPGADVMAVSAVSGLNLEELAGRYLLPGTTSVFLGMSGAGKSSLVNALAGQEKMPTGAVREGDGKGRHTTTRRQLIVLPAGAMVIDTPGMREIGMWEAGEGLDAAFGDVNTILNRGCRFSDCRHDTEPGCAVKAALDAGELARVRWSSWLSLQREAAYADDYERHMLDKRKRYEEIARNARQVRKNKV